MAPAPGPESARTRWRATWPARWSAHCWTRRACTDPRDGSRAGLRLRRRAARCRPEALSGRRFSQLRETTQGLLDDLLLAVEPVRFALGEADADVDASARARLGELPDELDVRDLTRHGDPSPIPVGSQLLRHGEVGIAGRPLGEPSGLVLVDRLDADPPVGKARRVEQQLPDLFDRRAASGTERELGHQGTSMSSSVSASSAVSLRSSRSGSTSPTTGARPRSTKLAMYSAPASRFTWRSQMAAASRSRRRARAGSPHANAMSP